MTGILGSSQSTRLWQFHFVCENREKERDRDTERQETETERKTEIQKQRGVSHKKKHIYTFQQCCMQFKFS